MLPSRTLIVDGRSILRLFFLSLARCIFITEPLTIDRNKARESKAKRVETFTTDRDSDHDALFCLIEWAFLPLSIDAMILRFFFGICCGETFRVAEFDFVWTFFSDVPSQLNLQVSQLPRLITNLPRRNLDSFVSTTAKVGNCDGKWSFY